MTPLDARTVAADRTSRAALEQEGLDYRLVDPGDPAQLAAAFRAIARGFLEEDPGEESVQAGCAVLAERRLVGVYDPSGPHAEWPVATVGSWTTPLTVPGGELPMWAISEVTVAGTHRRRGIARAMIEGELRAAADAGLAIAGLTVSEATIYGRYGFGPATWDTSWTIDTRRAGWAGREPRGRLQYVDREPLAEALGELHERTRALRAGEVPGWPLLWRQTAGAAPGERHASEVRGVRYVDAEGVLRGAMAYRIVESDADWARSRLEIRHLVGDTAEAVSALWGFAMQHDLIGTVTANARPVDEALPWLVSDRRAAVSKVRDREWMRILDVPRAFAARRCAAPLSIVLRVEDRLGFADGTWRVESSDDGSCRVTPAPADEAQIEVGVSELSSMYLGGTTAISLAGAGRVRGGGESLARLDAALRTERAPHLSIGY